MTEVEEPIVALFDLDGTLADHDGELHRRLERMRSPSEPPDAPVEVMWETAPEYLRERTKAIRGNPGFWINLPPLPGGFRGPGGSPPPRVPGRGPDQGTPSPPDRLDGEAPVV